MKTKILFLSTLSLAIFFISCKKDDPTPSGLVIEVTENITSNTLWLEGNTYVINYDIYVSANLTIQPGTKIKFKSNTGLYAAYYSGENATITAIGTEEKPIIFTSANPFPAAGDYYGIYLYDGARNCQFEYCTFEYGGKGDNAYDGMLHIRTSAKFTNCTFKHSKNAAINLDEGWFTEFTNNTFINNQSHAIKVYPNYVHTIGNNNEFNVNAGMGIFIYDCYGINIPGNYTWLNHNVPYIIGGGEVRISAPGAGAHLTIEPGTILKFNKYGYISVSYGDGIGTLKAEGTAESPIIFTSSNPNPAKGDWDSISLWQGATSSSFKHCEILYAGDYESYGAFSVRDLGTNNITIENTRIAHSKTYGITLYDSNIDYSSVSFDNNTIEDVKVW